MSVKTSFSSLGAFAVAAAFALSGCGGGSTTPATSNNAASTLGSTNQSVPIGSLDILHAASSGPVQITSRTPASPTIDVQDRATLTETMPGGNASGLSGSTQHAFTGTLNGAATSSAHRSTNDVAVNSPSDLSYQGGVVLGSAVSHNLFLNCDVSCRNAENFNPGQFLSDLGSDPFITVLYQYLQTPGVADTTPLTGSYTKGLGLLVNDSYQSNPYGGANPYYGQLKIALAVLNASQQPGMGGGGLGHIYHVFLPQNVDTCFEPGFGPPNGKCYSPDHNSTFYFCAYHGAFTATIGRQPQTFLYTVQPYQDVAGCRNNVYNQPLPNAAGGIDPADPGYSTLSHELFETISDPLLNAWFNGLSGNEIADLCASFDNFVTVNGRQYVLQSEYSDLHHICISGNLSNSAQTPQVPTY
jgi:hypothetical protein